MQPRIRSLLKLLTLVAIVMAAFWAYQRISEYFMEPTYRADRLFKPFGEDVYHIAQRIERGQSISTRAVKALPGGVNARYGAESTLLFQALGSRNVGAVDTLLGAGADPYMVDRPSQGSGRDFVYYLTLPGHPTNLELGFPYINELIKLYLKHGGDPNRRSPNTQKEPLISGVALIRNYEGIDILLDAEADPWAEDASGDNAMSILARRSLSHAKINDIIDRGYLKNLTPDILKGFIGALSNYLPRGDEISIKNQEIGLRVLKRNPNYQDDDSSKRLFAGPIPWDRVRNAK